MKKEQGIRAFIELGKLLINKLNTDELNEVVEKAYIANRWFTTENSLRAIRALAENFLNEEKLRKWLEGYSIPENKEPKTIGLVAAGNIPLVGWHDLMCIVLSGNKALVKLSSKDEVLPKYLIRQLTEIEPAFSGRIEIADQLKNFDAVIATGSNNTSRYFEYYFGKYPNLIRKGRNSVAILTGEETPEQLFELGKDIFSYFGMGCRNVSKLYVPEGYDFIKFLDALQPYQGIAQFFKFENNYNYYKSILLLNKEVHLDTGFLLLKESDAIASPMASLYFEYYENPESLKYNLASHEEEIQCIVGEKRNGIDTVGFGQSQFPELWDYADGVDTMEFLLSLN